MAPEYGATMGFFPIDAECVNYLRATGRSEEHCRAYENYYQAQGLWGIPKKGDIAYSQELELDLATVVPSVAGPKRPQDRIELPNLKESFIATFSKPVTESGFGMKPEELGKTFMVSGNGAIRRRRRQPGAGFRSKGPVAKYQSADRNRNGEQSSDARSRHGAGTGVEK